MFCKRFDIVIICVSIILISGCSSEERNKKSTSQPALPENKIEVRDAWARPAKQGMMGGAYFTIANGTDQADTLIHVSSDGAAIAEVHESYQQDNGLSGMRPAGDLPIESGATLELKPGGYHLMLMQLNWELAVGDSISATLYFSNYDSLTVQLPVRQNHP